MKTKHKMLIGVALAALLCVLFGQRSARADESLGAQSSAKSVPARVVPYSSGATRASYEPVRWGYRDYGYYGPTRRAYYGPPPRYYPYEYGYYGRPYRYGPPRYYRYPYGVARVGPVEVYVR